jgi:alpha/beta superfamily hydrolase
VAEVRNLWIPGPEGRLEAALRVAARPRAAVVVAHPHPLHGGTLHNPVVFHAERELHRDRMTTLRFNFRGVGSSEGAHDEGRGEVEDLKAAASWVRGLAPDVPLLVVGYSFGSVCSVRLASQDPTVSGVIGIGLPARIYPLREVAEMDAPLSVVQADADEFGSLDEVRRLLDETDPPGSLYIVGGTTHLFEGKAREAGQAVLEAGREIVERLGTGA